MNFFERRKISRKKVYLMKMANVIRIYAKRILSRRTKKKKNFLSLISGKIK